MEMNTQDYLKKALLDTQEKVRDYMNYAEKVDNEELRSFFQQYAEAEGRQAQQLQKFVSELS